MVHSRNKICLKVSLIFIIGLIFSVSVFTSSRVNPRETGSSRQKRRTDAKPLQKPATSLSYYVTITGGGYITVTDEMGHSNRPVVTNAKDNQIGDFMAAKVANVSIDVLGEQTMQVVMPVNQTYTITFHSDGHPISIELIEGEDNQTPERAVRYTDLVLPAGVSVMLKIVRQRIETLRYDKDGDGTYEMSVQPTVDVSGAAARDITGPAVNFAERLVHAKCTVTITARDSGSGVKAIYYSLDGKKYQAYLRPLILDVASTTVVYAFADDRVANRSSISSYKLKKRCLGFTNRG